MSWHDEVDLIDMDEDDILEEKIKLRKKKKWRMKDGDVIKIQNMETSHIKNTMALLKRNGDGLDYLPLFKKELKRRKKEIERQYLSGLEARITAMEFKLQMNGYQTSEENEIRNEITEEENE